MPIYSKPVTIAIEARTNKLNGIAGFDCFPMRRGIIGFRFDGGEFEARHLTIWLKNLDGFNHPDLIERGVKWAIDGL